MISCRYDVDVRAVPNGRTGDTLPTRDNAGTSRRALVQSVIEAEIAAHRSNQKSRVGLVSGRVLGRRRDQRAQAFGHAFLINELVDSRDLRVHLRNFPK